MIVDTSVIVAILQVEPEGPTLTSVLAAATASRMSAATYVEAAIVTQVRGVGDLLDPLLGHLGVDIVPCTADDARVARRAHQRYGRGSGSPARLNFGDCMAYALSVRSGEPLLFTGEDFTHTDVVPVR